MTIEKDDIAMLRFLLDSNIMDGEDIAKYAMKEEKLKEQKVLEVHKNKITKSVRIKNGKPYEFYQTCYGEGSKERMKCSTYKAIIGKLYEVYFGRVHRMVASVVQFGVQVHHGIAGQNALHDVLEPRRIRPGDRALRSGRRRRVSPVVRRRGSGGRGEN